MLEVLGFAFLVALIVFFFPLILAFFAILFLLLMAVLAWIKELFTFGTKK